MPTPTTSENVAERFWGKVLLDPHACWEWQGAKTYKGYGQIRINGTTIGAHRVAYEMEVGPIPAGLHIDHLCRNPACVRPDHMEPVTQQENILRGEGTSAVNAGKTHCPAGHPYSDENTFYETRPNGRVGRRCKQCNAERCHYRYMKQTEGVVLTRNRSKHS